MVCLYYMGFPLIPERSCSHWLCGSGTRRVETLEVKIRQRARQPGAGRTLGCWLHRRA